MLNKIRRAIHDLEILGTVQDKLNGGRIKRSHDLLRHVRHSTILLPLDTTILPHTMPHIFITAVAIGVLRGVNK